MKAGATKTEITYYKDEVVKVMIWEYESDTAGSGKVVYEKAGWKDE